MAIFEVEGYWKDDKSEFYGEFINEFDDTPEGWEDDHIFYYGLSEEYLESSSEEDGLEFVITGYRRYEYL